MRSESTATEKKKIISLFQNVQISAVVLPASRTTWGAVSVWSVWKWNHQTGKCCCSEDVCARQFFPKQPQCWTSPRAAPGPSPLSATLQWRKFLKKIKYLYLILRRSVPFSQSINWQEEKLKEKDKSYRHIHISKTNLSSSSNLKDLIYFYPFIGNLISGPKPLKPGSSSASTPLQCLVPEHEFTAPWWAFSTRKRRIFNN